MASMEYTFAEEDPKEVAKYIIEKYTKLNAYISSQGIRARWYKSFRSYYGFYYQDRSSEYGIGSVGSQSEQTAVVVNQYRNLIQHTLALFTQNKVSFDVIPYNSDVEGRNAAIVGNSTLEYLLEQSKYNRELYSMAEIGLLLGTSFLRVDWNQNKKFVGIDGDNQPVFSGELKYKAFTPMDVFLEPFIECFEDQEWICTREIVNRYDLISKYPDKRQEILSMDRISDIQLADPYFLTDDDHVWLLKLYHKSTMALPFGRYTVFGTREVVFEDYKENPFCDIDPQTSLPILGTGIPIVCFRPAVTYGSAWGHTVGFDLLPLQDMKNLLSSTIATNQALFGVQNLIVPRGTNMDFADIANGARVLEYDVNPDLGPGGGAPSVLELLKTPNEIFNYNNKIDEEMEKISGINGALRGTPPPQVGSGTAMALLTTQAQTFNTPVENAYVSALQDVANISLKMIAKFMPNMDLVQIVGLKENFAIKSFKAEELSRIQKVKALTANAMSKSPAGRLAMAQDMMNSGQITPTQYTEVAQTGTLKNDMEDVTAEDALIQWENQQLIQGIEVVALLADNPLKHIKQHCVTLTHPDVRNDAQKQAVIMKHLAAHQQNWVILGAQNPQLLALITGSPIPPDVPNPGVTAGAPQQGQLNNPASPHVPPHVEPPKKHVNAPQVGKNNMQNASTPGGDTDLAASAMRSASKLLTHGRK